MIKQIRVPEEYYLFLLGSGSLILICLAINFFTKISAHLAGAGGLTGAMTGISIRLNIDLVMLITIIILCSGLIGFARLKLNAHNPAQIYAGFICGMIVMTIFLLI
jgi:membrane-associated phospholipid phosphatase